MSTLSQAGKTLGSAKSPAKSAAAKKNGQAGGRPRGSTNQHKENDGHKEEGK